MGSGDPNSLQTQARHTLVVECYTAVKKNRPVA